MPDFVDLEELVIQWAEDFPIDKNVSKERADILPEDINWVHFRSIPGETKYFDQLRGAKPKSHILFSANFANNTDSIQVYSLKTERRTKSTCSLNMTRAWTRGFNVNIKIGPPNPIVSANAGFKGEMSVTSTTNTNIEEEITWSVDNQISVPAHYKTRADLVITEDEYSGNFQTETSFEGKIHVTLRSKKDNSVITTITGDVKNILKPDKGFRSDKTGLYFTSRGSCNCRFGIEQHVTLTQSEITGDEVKPIEYTTMEMI